MYSRQVSAHPAHPALSSIDLRCSNNKLVCRCRRSMPRQLHATVNPSCLSQSFVSGLTPTGICDSYVTEELLDLSANIVRIGRVDTSRAALALCVCDRSGHNCPVRTCRVVGYLLRCEFIGIGATNIVRFVTSAHSIVTARVATQQNNTSVHLGCCSEGVRSHRVANTKGSVCTPTKVKEFVVGLAT